jgi:hypothetical protein
MVKKMGVRDEGVQAHKEMNNIQKKSLCFLVS